MVRQHHCCTEQRRCRADKPITPKKEVTTPCAEMLSVPLPQSRVPLTKETCQLAQHSLCEVGQARPTSQAVPSAWATPKRDGFGTGRRASLSVVFLSLDCE